MTARLIFLTGSRAGTAVDLTDPIVSLGRQSDRTIVFPPHDVLVSAVHATIAYGDGQYVLTDDESRNGTFVGTDRIAHHVLQDGDLIQLGPGGPAAKFVIETEAGLARTLDPADLERAKRLIEATRRQVADATRVADSPGDLSSTREMVAETDRRTRSTRRNLLGVTGLVLLAVASGFVWQQRNRAKLESALSELSFALASERDSRSALEQEVIAIQGLADSLQRVVDEGDRFAAGGRIDPNVIREYSRSVALIVFAYGYGRPNSNELLRYQTASRDEAERQAAGIGFGGSGPPLRREGTATGFLVDSAGYLLTNRHVAVPWSNDDELAAMRSRGLAVIGRVLELRVYFPPGTRSFPAVVENVSADADVAIIRVLGAGPLAPVLPLAPASTPAPGDQLLLIGYPTGVHNLLFRVDSTERTRILNRAGTNLTQLIGQLSERRLIQPLITIGTVSDVTTNELIHTAETTVGGSGGPLIDVEERVVAVHYASVRSPSPGDPFRTQRGVPIRFAVQLAPIPIGVSR